MKLVFKIMVKRKRENLKKIKATYANFNELISVDSKVR